MTADHLIHYLQLQPHPEGGYYKETYRSAQTISNTSPGNSFPNDRSYSTAIYFLLPAENFSAFHRIKSDECWHFYEGGTLNIHILYKEGDYQCIHLGRNIEAGEVYQYVVPAGAWFASEPAPQTAFALVGCTVSPGFDFADFEMAKANKLIKMFPEQKDLIERLCR